MSPVVPLATTVIEGHSVFFLHGLFGRGKNFTGIAKALQPDFRSVLVDLPNHGSSPWTDAFSYTDMADSVAELLGKRKRGPVTLVGHSMGGKVAMLVGLLHPEMIDKLVIVDVPPAHTAGASEFRHLLASLAEVDLGTITSRADADEQLKDLIPNRRTRGFLLQNLRQTAQGWGWQANLDLLRRELPNISAWPGNVVAGRTFGGPVMSVVGSESEYVRPEHYDLMRAIFPRMFQVSIKGAGHWVHSEKSKEFVSALNTFLRTD